LLQERFPKFPGHEAARSAWAAATAKHKINWKAFYREQYDINVEPSLFGEIADAMATADVAPPAADSLVASLEQLASRREPSESLALGD
jgi:hypothetical protein